MVPDRGTTEDEENTMKYLLLKHYRGGPTPMPSCTAPMDQWTPEAISAHIGFMNDMAEDLRQRGELVDAQAVSPEGTSSGTTGRAGPR